MLFSDLAFSLESSGSHRWSGFGDIEMQNPMQSKVKRINAQAIDGPPTDDVPQTPI
jgi:hypothetical protein